MGSWEAKITNPGGAVIYVNAFGKEPRMEEYEDIDRPNSAKFEAVAETPALKYADIDLYYDGEISLRGVVTFVEEKSDGSLAIEAKSKEWLLQHRYTFYYTYPHDAATVGDILNDALTGSYVGLLAQARGLLPPNMFSLYSGSTYKLTGGGTAGVFGSNVPYHDTTALTLGSDKDSLSAGQYWRDASDLYVRIVGSVSPRYELVSVHNWCDPKIRLGDITDISSETFATPYRLAVGRTVWDYTIKLLKSLGAYVQWRAPPNDPYVYLDASLSTFGRGTSKSSVYQFSADRYVIDRIDPDDLQVHGLIGIGCGDGKTTELSSVLATSVLAGSNIVLDTYRDGYLYEDYLAEVVSSIFGDRQAVDCLTIEGPDAPLKCGDWVGIEGAARAVVKKVVREGDWMTLWTGRRPRDKADIQAATTSMLSEGSSFASSHLNMWKDSASGNVTSDVPFVWESEFSDEDGVIDESFADATRVYLNFSIDWFKAEIANVDSNLHGHGNATGAGSGSAHGDAGAGGYLVHGATSQASTDDVTVHDSTTFDILSNDNYTEVGSVSGIYYDTAVAFVDAYSDYAITYLEGYTDYCSACAETYVTDLYYDEDEFIYDIDPSGAEFVTDLSADGVYVAADGHGHATSGTLWTVSNYLHYHTIGVDDHAEHVDHAVTDNPQPGPLGIDDQIAEELPVDYWTSQQPTGTLRYLTLRIYIDSGLGYVEIPASPFEDYYIGDGESGIDVTDYIELGGLNSIKVTGEEYGGSEDVRFNVSLSLSAQVVLTAL